MRYSVFAGGKRLRPILTLAAADAVARATGSTPDLGSSLALPAACAIELIHTYSLIHDDLPAMDNDTLRRGRPTLHVVYGDGIAILAGDGLQAAAFTILAGEPEESSELSKRRLRVTELISRAAGPAGMVGGQAIDLQAAGQVPGHSVVLDAERLRGMHARKTGAMIRASAVAGAVMADGTEYMVNLLQSRGEPIAEIYAVEGTPLVTGPSAVMARAANPNAARLFYAWSMTAEAQQMNVDVGALRSAHPLVKDRSDRKKLTDIKLLREDAAAVADQADDIKARYLKLFKV